MSRKTLNQDEDNLRMIELFFDASGNNVNLKKIIRDHSHPFKNKSTTKNPEIESSEQLQNNTSFITTNERCMNCSCNFVKKAISTMSDMVKSVLKAFDDDKGGSPDHVNLVKSCISTITLLNHVLATFSRKIRII